jgi:hypothetical protein
MKYTVADGFPYYIELAGQSNVRQLLASAENFKLFESLTEAQSHHRYAPGKWSIKQIIGHITDHERIMSYRALRFSRKDLTPLPGYDQDFFVDNSRSDELSLPFLIQDLKNVRQATLSLLDSFSEEQLQRKGLAWKFELTVEDTLKATIGHELHHMQIIREKYLKGSFEA